MKRFWIGLLVVALAVPPAGSEDDGPNAGISLNFQNSDIDLVLKFFTELTGRTFVRSDLVRGFITVSAPNRVSADEALELLGTVLELKGFVLLPGPGSVIKVLAQAEALQTGIDVADGAADLQQGPERLMTLAVPLKYANAAEVKSHLTPLVSRAGHLIADERMNTVLLTDVTSNLRRLLKLIDNLDVRTPQVLIEALLMEVSLTDETKLGVEWNYRSRLHSREHAFDAETGQAFNLSSFITEGLTYAVIRDDLSLSGLIQALSTSKDVNILSTPHILTLNNQPAIIRVGEEVPVLTQTRNIQGGETIRSFDFKSVAIELEVTPRINHERDVLLKVHPLVKKILGFNPELNAPILATREAQTSVLVRDGQTVVIGGLMKDDRSRSDSKVPILGDLPLIGRFFKRTSTVSEKTELLVFITPRVITSDEQARAVTIHKEAESRSPRTPNRQEAKSLERLGRFHYGERRYEEAIAAWEEALQIAPDERAKRRLRRRMGKARKKLSSRKDK